MPVKMYDWEAWFRKRRFVLERVSGQVPRGMQYRGDPRMMAQQIRNAASARRLSVSVVEGAKGALTVLVMDNHYQKGGA